MNKLICFILLLTTAHFASAQLTVSDKSVKPDPSDIAYCYIDGIKVRGSANLPGTLMEEVTIITGGIPVDYGDISSSIISIGNRNSDFFLKKEGENVCLTPNPATESVSISLEDDAYIGGSILLRSLSGKVLQTLTINEKRVLLDVTNLPPGTYIVSIEKNGEIVTETLVIE